MNIYAKVLKFSTNQAIWKRLRIMTKGSFSQEHQVDLTFQEKKKSMNAIHSIC